MAVPLLALAVGAPLVQAGLGAANASFTSRPRSRLALLKLRSLTELLFLMQPLARLAGRLTNGLTPWRLRGRSGLALPRPRTIAIWSERWRAPDAWLGFLEAALRARQAPVRRGGEYDRWDLEVRGGILGAVRLRAVIEEHGAGRQLARFRSWPRCLPRGGVLTLLFGALAGGAALDRAWIACGLIGAIAGVLALRIHDECAAASAAVIDALSATERGAATDPGLPLTGASGRDQTSEVAR